MPLFPISKMGSVPVPSSRDFEMSDKIHAMNLDWQMVRAKY